MSVNTRVNQGTLKGLGAIIQETSENGLLNADPNDVAKTFERASGISDLVEAIGLVLKYTEEPHKYSDLQRRVFHLKLEACLERFQGS